MIAIDRNPVVTRLIVVSIIVLLLITLGIMGNRDNGSSNINTNETVVTINEDKNANDTVRININESSRSALETLPGIGSALADEIIENRPYVSPWDLLEVDGIGENTVKGLLDYIEV